MGAHKCNCAKFIQSTFTLGIFVLQILYLFMTSELNWFESPIPKPSSFYRQTLSRFEPEPEPEQSHFLRDPSLEHIQVPPTPKHDDQSPWTRNINAFQHHLDNMPIAGLIPEQSQHDQGICQKFYYSAEEDQQAITPLEECSRRVHGQTHTNSGKKSEQENAMLKKSRPKEKGLRKLSQRAYEIVQDLRNATYKEVAAKLLLQISEEDLQSERNQEQNIKRRVYDALNVLIALGVLKKDGRKIVSESFAKKGQKYEFGRQQEQESLKMKLKSREKALEEKKKKLKQAQDKLSAIETLLKRNKLADEEENNTDKDTGIQFPFVALLTSSKNIQNIQRKTNEDFMMKSTDPIQPFGDIDSLKWLKQSFDNMSAEEETSVKKEAAEEKSNRIEESEGEGAEE